MRMGYDANGTCTMIWLSELNCGTNTDLSDWRSPSIVPNTYEKFLQCLDICVKGISQNDEWTRDHGHDDIEDDDDWGDEDEYYSRPYHLYELGLVCAISSDANQTESERFMEQFGFQKSGPFTSLKYLYTSKTTLWWMHAPELVKRLEEEMKAKGLTS